MLIITHRIKTSSEFMDRYLPGDPAGGLFLAEKLGMPEGSKICLELMLGWLDETYYAYAEIERAGVVWDNCGARQKGVIARFAPHEAPLRDTLLAKVRASAEAYVGRSAQRQPLSMEVHYFDAQRKRPRAGEVVDISPTGVFIRSARPYPTGREVHLRFEDREHQVMRHARGRVSRLDFDGPVAGMGVEFQFESRREKRAMKRLCGHLSQR